MQSGMQGRLGAAPLARQARALRARAPRPGRQNSRTIAQHQWEQQQPRRSGQPPAALPPAAAAAPSAASPPAAAAAPPPPPAAPSQLPHKAGTTLAESKMYRTRPQDEGRLCSEFRFSQAFTQQ